MIIFPRLIDQSQDARNLKCPVAQGCAVATDGTLLTTFWGRSLLWCRKDSDTWQGGQLKEERMEAGRCTLSWAGTGKV